MEDAFGMGAFSDAYWSMEKGINTEKRIPGENQSYSVGGTAMQPVAVNTVATCCKSCVLLDEVLEVTSVCVSK